MKFAQGNEKLGDNCIVVSRPVGDTCPSSCQFLGNGCYAEFTEKRFPNARKAGFTNLITEWNKIRSMIVYAVEHNKTVRFHERGDFGQNDVVDMEYVENIERACLDILRKNGKLPEMWSYTHFYDSRIVTRLSSFIKLYASVHNSEDIEKAERAGFKLFAWCDTDGLIAKHKKGGNPDAPKTIELCGKKFVTCPEMRRGRDKITCTGKKNGLGCNLCTLGLANVGFLNH